MSERLPENGKYYLWCSDMGSVQSDYYWDGFDKERKYGYNIVAWMPLPEPYTADRKTENSSEKPNNCDTCRNKGVEGCEQPCLGCGCCGLYEPKDEPTGYNLTPVEDEPQTDIHDLTDCDFCKDRNCKDCEGGKDEPQMDCQWK